MIYSIPYFEYAVGFSMTGFIVKSGYSIQDDLQMFQDSCITYNTKCIPANFSLQKIILLSE